jgi:dUTP pyrophosphatase
VEILPGETKLIKTGLALEIPEGYAGLIYARSGLASKRGLAPANKVGVVDPDYRGEVMVALHNHSALPQTVADGERIAQLVITPFLRVEFEESEALSDTERGEGGFGSTGTTVTLSHTEVGENARRYFWGDGVPYDRKRAVELLRLAVREGDLMSQVRLGYLTCEGDEVGGIKADTEQGIAYLTPCLEGLKQQMQAGDSEAMLLWGNLLLHGYAMESDPEAAARLFYAAAEAGFAPAAGALGQCFNAATGVKPDDLRAVSCYRRAAEGGYAPAQFHLGVCYYNGQGVKVDKAEAAKWYALAAEQGYAPAQFTLGKHYYQVMNGVKNDPEKCIRWLTLAAEQGYEKAVVFLADVYHNAGNNTADTLAAKWYAVGCEMGNLYCTKQLSVYVRTGRGGTEPDEVRAKELLARAARGGLKEAESLYRELYGTL